MRLGLPRLTWWRVACVLTTTAVQVAAVCGTVAYQAGRVMSKIESIDERTRDLTTRIAAIEQERRHP